MQPQDRLDRIDAFGSPTFQYTVSSISASGYVLIDLENGTPANGTAKAFAKYLPATSLKIANASASNLRVTAGSNVFLVPASTVVVKDNIAYSTVKIDELSASAVTSDQVYVDVWRDPISEDAMLRRKVGGTPRIGMG